jgi:hypothetical protein
MDPSSVMNGNSRDTAFPLVRIRDFCREIQRQDGAAVQIMPEVEG